MSSIGPALIGAASDVVSAYLAQNRIAPAVISGLIASVHATFVGLGVDPEVPVLPVPIRMSFADAHFIGL